MRAHLLRIARCATLGATLGLLASVVQAAVVVVAHPGVRKLDTATVERIYSGKVVELDGQAVVPVNLPPQHPLRRRFLKDFMQRDEPSYLAYWTVRRYVGKGAPPKEVGNPSEVILHVLNNPGAIGYVEEADVPAGVNIVARGAKTNSAAP